MAIPKLEKIEQTRVVYRGLTRAAKYCGCSLAHLSYVLHGQRRAGAALRRRLARMGVTSTVNGSEI